MQLPVPGLGLTFAAPWGLAVGAGAAAALVALHAVTVGRPRPAWLPTARFAPDRPPRAARRLRRPSDRALLAARVLAALCAGAALARPVPTPARRATARVIVAERSTGAAPGAVRAAAGAAAQAGDVLVPFAERPGAPLALAADPAARARQLDSALGTAAGGAPGDALGNSSGGPPGAALGSSPGGARRAADAAPASLSAALVAARRAAPAAAAGADSVELVIVSPLGAEVVDAATAAVRAAWGGRARVVRVAAAAPAAAPRPGQPQQQPAVALRDAPPDDALAAALALAGVPAAADAPVRVARGRVAPADLAWAREPGRVLVVWPAGGVPADGVPADGAAAGPPNGSNAPNELGPPDDPNGPGDPRTPGRAADSAYALAAPGAGAAPAVAVAPFARPALPDTAAHDGVAPRVAARWADGRPAAVERPLGAGCVRTVAVAVPQAGDAALRAGFRALLPALVGPCGGPRDRAPLPPADVVRLAGTGPLLAAAPLRARLAPPSPDLLGAGLLALALAALAAEWPLRRAARRGEDAQAGADAGDAGGAADANEAARARRAPATERVAA